MTSEDILELIDPIIAPKQINPVQKMVLRYCWQGFSYAKISKTIDYKLSYVKETGSTLWKILSVATGEKVTKTNFRGVILKYSPKKQAFSQINSQQNWGNVPDTSIFYGREKELATLKQWIITDKCRLIAILGLGGIGKTSLAAKLAENIQKEVDYLFWQSLKDAPPLKEFLKNLIQFLSPENRAFPETENDQLLELQKCLAKARCLIILDNFEALLSSKQENGVYLKDYEKYGELLKILGESSHQSCLIMTSREKPAEIARLQGKSLSVREYRLSGLEQKEGYQLLKTKGILHENINTLVEYYQGNPLALKIVASSIQKLFAGNVKAFLQQEILVFNGISHLLQFQIERLSELELSVMYWLAINREPCILTELQADIFPSSPDALLLETLESLQSRSLIETTNEGFTQQPVIMEYMTQELIKQIASDLDKISYRFLNHYALIKATTKDYIRQSQIRTIIKGLITFLNPENFRKRCQEILGQLRSSGQTKGYAAGNILNLCKYLQIDVTGWDFSHLAVWQAYLSETRLRQVNLNYADLSRSVLTQTFGGIFCVTFSPVGVAPRRVGRLLATSDTNGEVQIWDLTTFQKLKTFKADLTETWSIVFSPDGTMLASGGDSSVVKIWAVQSGECLKTLEGHNNTINAIAFSPNGEILASSSTDQTIRLWSVLAQPAAGKDFSENPRILQGHQGRIWSMAFSPDGSTLVSGSEDLTLKLWNIQTGECLQTLEGHSKWVKSIAFSPDGKTIASGSFDGVIKLWSPLTGQCLKTWIAHQGCVIFLTYNSRDPNLLASCSCDQTVKIWSIKSGQYLNILNEHTNRVWSVAWSPDGQYLATGGDDHTTRLWHLQTGQCTKIWQGHSNKLFSLAVNEEAQILAVGSEDQTIKLWNLETGKITGVLLDHQNKVSSVAFSPTNSSLLASGSEDRTIKLWQFNTEECLTTLRGHLTKIGLIIFSPDGRQLISCSYDGTIKVWDVITGECLQTLRGHNAPVVGLTLSPNGQYLASGSSDSTIKLWDLKTGQCLRTFLGHQNRVWAIAFSLNGSYLASGSSDKTLKIWDVVTGECLETLTGHSTPIMSLAFNDEQLVSGGFDGTIKVWNLTNRVCLHTLAGHNNSVCVLKFAQIRGKDTLISGSFDETIKFWDSQTGECLSTLRTPRPYDGMNIKGVRGLTETQRLTLKALGAVEED